MEETTNLLAHSFGNIMCLCGSYFHPRCGMLMLCSDSETLEPSSLCSLPLLPANNKNKQKNKMAEESKRTRNKAAGAAGFTQDRGVFYTSEIMLLIVKTVLQPKNN